MLSVTNLCSYLYCKRKLFLNKVLGLYEPPREVTFKGTLTHEFHDTASKEDESIVKAIKTKLTKEEIKERYIQRYKQILRQLIIKNKEKLEEFKLDKKQVFSINLPIAKEEAELRSENVYKTMQKYSVFGDELWEKLTPKIISELWIEDSALGLRGIVDKIYDYKTELVPIELKTGKAPQEGVWPGHKIQIAAYSVLLESKYKTEVKEGFVNYLEVKQNRHIPINAFLRLEVKDMIKKVNELINSIKLPDFCENRNKCNACGLKEMCFDNKGIKRLMKDKTKTLNIS